MRAKLSLDDIAPINLLTITPTYRAWKAERPVLHKCVSGTGSRPTSCGISRRCVNVSEPGRSIDQSTRISPSPTSALRQNLEPPHSHLLQAELLISFLVLKWSVEPYLFPRNREPPRCTLRFGAYERSLVSKPWKTWTTQPTVSLPILLYLTYVLNREEGDAIDGGNTIPMEQAAPTDSTHTEPVKLTTVEEVGATGNDSAQSEAVVPKTVEGDVPNAQAPEGGDVTQNEASTSHIANTNPVPRQPDNQDTDSKHSESVKKELQQEVDDDNDSDSDVNELINKPLSNYVLERAERLSTKTLYDIYARKRDAEDKKKPAGPKRSKAPRIVRGFADYVRALEDRIAKLEADSGAKATQEEAPLAEVISATGDPSMRTTFYRFSNGQTFDFIDQIDDEKWKEKGTFTSEVDERQFLRVLYQGGSTQNDTTTSADPGPDIDILALQLFSAPVATFLENMAPGIMLHNDNLLRLTKPFRLLIQNAEAMKDQMKRLQERYR